eukprot:scaffold32659_cov101-Isochrysis_galbana.AAC.1
MLQSDRKTEALIETSRSSSSRLPPTHASITTPSHSHEDRLSLPHAVKVAVQHGGDASALLDAGLEPRWRRGEARVGDEVVERVPLGSHNLGCVGWLTFMGSEEE